MKLAIKALLKKLSVLAYRKQKINPEILMPQAKRIKQFKRFVSVGQRVLEIGTGSGILAELAFLKGAKEVVAVDINPAAVKEASKRVPKANVFYSNLFENVTGVYDTIIFAAPWSEGEINKPRDYAIYDCGVTERFFKDVKGYLANNGYIWFQYCDAFINKYNKISEFISRNGLKIYKCWDYKDWGALVKHEVTVFLYKIGIDGCRNHL